MPLFPDELGRPGPVAPGSIAYGRIRGPCRFGRVADYREFATRSSVSGRSSGTWPLDNLEVFAPRIGGFTEGGFVAHGTELGADFAFLSGLILPADSAAPARTNLSGHVFSRHSTREFRNVSIMLGGERF